MIFAFRKPRFALGLAIWLAAGIMPARAATLDIQTVTGASQVSAWLVSMPSSPVVSLRLAFPGGSTTDPVGKEGRAVLLASTLGQGGGDRDAASFRQRLAVLGTRMSFDATRDALSVSLDTLAGNLEESIALLADALHKPRFDEEVILRAKARAMSDVEAATTDAASAAEDAWYAAIFPGTEYARPPGGTASGLAALGRDDLLQAAAALLNRNGLLVVAVGDATPDRLSALLDPLLSALPRHDVVKTPLPTPSVGGGDIALTREAPEANVVFGMPAVPRTDAAFLPALVMNEMLGGAPLGSRLAEALRVRQGLVYSIDTRLVADRYAALIVGQYSCGADKCEAARLSVIEEIMRLAAFGPADDELSSVKDYLIGSFALSFDSNQKIADNLIAMRLGGYPPEYLETRRAMLEKVTHDDVAAVARRLLARDMVLFVTVGPAVSK